MSTKRNYGIDLLRIVSMIMIPVLHILGQGAILDRSSALSGSYKAAWLLEIVCYCAVNVYGIISGYVGYGKKRKLSRFLQMYLQVIFYTLLGCIVFAFYKPELVNAKVIRESVFPFAYEVYWYYTAYFCLYFFMPFLDKLIERNGKEENRKMLLAALVIFSILQTAFHEDFAHTNHGYSFLWLALMYLVGGYIRKYDVGRRENRLKNLLGYVLCALFVWFWKIGSEQVRGSFTGWYEPSVRWINYVSPFIVVCAVLLVLYFKEVRFGNKLTKIVCFFSPASFDVYLAHQIPLVRDTFIIGAFAVWLAWNPFVMVMAVIGSALSIWLIGSLTGRLRILIFSLFRMNKLCDLLAGGIENFTRRLLKYNP